MFKEQELILAQQAASLAIWEWTIRTDKLRWSPGSALIFGRPTEELKTREDVLACIAPQDRERVRREGTESLNEPNIYKSEFRTTWPNGETRWIREHGKTVQDPERGPILLGVSQDVTESKIKETRLLAQVQLLELAHEPILVRDSQNRITYWNKGAQRLYGFTWQEAKGQISHNLLRTQFPESLASIEARLNANGFWEGELIHATKDGRLVHVSSRWQKFSAGPFFVLETNFDLSQQKALQIARLWEEKAKLIGELSHEINNPLAAATNATYMLKAGCNEPAQQYLDVLEAAINRIAQFIRKYNEVHQSVRSQESSLQNVKPQLQ